MKITTNFLLLFYVSLAKCTNVDSYEINRIEFTPLHDAIILNDIVDIFSEFENNMSPQLTNHMFSNSESEEDIENLLSEYQQYLDKAHEQRINYIRRNKNKVPHIRHENFNKLKPIERNNYHENSNFYFNDMKHPAFLNTFMPHNSNIKFVKKNDNLFDFSKNLYDGKKSDDLPTILPENLSKTMMSSCFCQENIFPCKCQCKKCFYNESALSRNFNKINHLTNSFLKIPKPFEDNPSNNLDNNLSLRIKIDVQLPNALSNLLKYLNQFEKYEEHEDTFPIPRDPLSTINLPFPYLNYSIPIDLIGYKQNILKDKSPIHKITIHKKKKFRFGNNNKKHKTKKMYNLQNFKFEPQLERNITNITKVENSNSSFNKNSSFNNNEDTNLKTNETTEMTLNHSSDKTTVTHTPRIVLTLNITKGSYNRSENASKIGNSIEADFEIEKDNVSNTKLLRLKREINNKSPNYLTLLNSNKSMTTSFAINNRSIVPVVISSKKLDTESEVDTELVYWPLAKKDQSLIHSKNITALILDREIKKTKLNMTKDKLINNHTTALEKAIFGDVDWNDIDAVVPAFMSFVGKYITGVLTFCSENICHSMKCAKKLCLHRICTPDNRYNSKGHCAGNNYTDSVATMESIMDLPSNIAFEVVDILEEKMLGKLFGKGTLCIHSKCSAFAAFKKTFKKAKCTFKELNIAGHCPNLKNIKII
ncbi:protein PFC0760c-like [Vanessa tameamea]|uniref:Protein PFC0760c-like n=1 Tax=Vanessa tameamea TaxID=334116 RepID=A0ABM4ANF1_VANTA